MCSEIIVPLLNPDAAADVECLSDELDMLHKYELKNESWPQFKTACTAAFTMAHTELNIQLKFYVKNDHFKSSFRHINGDVNEDNCVEFFIGFNGDRNYYNLEFNCLGIGKVAYGTGRENRVFLSSDVIKKIKVWNRAETVDGYFNWEIMLVIPISIFEYHQLNGLKGLSCRGNFYKCGDGLPAPHFLSWNKIETPHPDFHQPEYFGNILFK